MPKFKDTNGREWSVAINVGTLTKANEFAGVNLYDFQSLVMLSTDPIALCRVLYSVCDAESAGVSYETFADNFNGDALEAASDSLVKAVLEFMPADKRAKYEATLKAGQLATEANDAEIKRMLESGELERLMRESVSAPLRNLESQLQSAGTA